MDDFLFSDAWAKACRAEINASTAYREAALTWEDAVAFAMDIPGGERAVFVDLWHGECREARTALPGDLDKAPYVIRGDEATWHAVLDGQLEPLQALVTGRLRLVKGNVGALAFHIKSARELVAAASRVREKRASGSYGAVSG
jgi:SCP-2 sterol transfer family protein